MFVLERSWVKGLRGKLRERSLGAPERGVHLYYEIVDDQDHWNPTRQWSW